MGDMMPKIQVIFFRANDGSVPFLDWLDKQRVQRVKDKCWAAVKLLAVYGHELHRPYSDSLHDGIRELRTRIGRQNYRILYFFHGRNIVIISHGIIKEDDVPESEIQRAIRMRELFSQDPSRHSYSETEHHYEKE
jgi:hypothetical protein